MVKIIIIKCINKIDKIVCKYGRLGKYKYYNAKLVRIKKKSCLDQKHIYLKKKIFFNISNIYELFKKSLNIFKFIP